MRGTMTGTTFRDIWRLDTTNEIKRRTWWWWWWIFFFKNKQNPERPKQLMVLWGTRNCSKLNVNGYDWENTKMREVTDSKAKFDGIAAAWYYDGAKMHEPMFIDSGRISLTGDDTKGSLRMDGKDGNYRFEGTPGVYDIEADLGRKTGISLKTTLWTDELAKVVPTGRTFIWKLGYSMLKHRGLKVSGTVRLDGKDEAVEGTAYFQNVKINSVTSPWYWATFQCSDGSYFQYTIYHIGMPALRRSRHHDSKLDFKEKNLSCNFTFYNAQTKTTHVIKNIKVTRTYENDLPTFHLEGDEDGQSIRATMIAYSRACWILGQPTWGLMNTKLHYNEYPATLAMFNFKSIINGEKRSVNGLELGSWAGNCEHSWGLI